MASAFPSMCIKRNKKKEFAGSKLLFWWSSPVGQGKAAQSGKKNVLEQQCSPTPKKCIGKSPHTPQLFLKKSCKKLGTSPKRFQTSFGFKGNDVPLKDSLPTSPFGQYKAAQSGRFIFPVGE